MIESLLSLPKQVTDMVTNMTTLLTRLSATWAGKLDSLRAGLSDTRMAYLDKLNITGNVASAADVAGAMRVKAIYRGTLTINAYASTGSASIGGTIDPTKANVSVLGISTGNAASCHITGVTSTAINAASANGNSVQIVMGWQVVEYY